MAEQKKTVADVRPRLPWFQRVGMTNGEINSAGALIRGAGALLVLVNPVTAAVMWVELLTLSRTRIKGWWLSLPAGVLLVVALFAGWIANYNAVWRAAARAIEEAFRARSAMPLTDVAAEWQHWLVLQLPVAFIAGTLLAGAVLSYRSRYHGTWRERASKKASERTVQRALRTASAGLPHHSAERADDVTVRLGVDAETAKPFDFPGAAMRMHAIIGGPTGFGKSTTIQQLAYMLVGHAAAQKARVGAVMVDMKGDHDMIDFMRRLAHAAGRGFHLVTVDPRESAGYNPLRHGNAAQIKSRLIEAEANAADGGFSEPHYRRLGERFLLVVATALCDLVSHGALDTFDGVRRAWRQDLPDLVRLMDMKKLGKQTDRLSGDVARLVTRYLAEVEAAGLERDVYGLYNRYALIVEGAAGPIMTEQPGGVDLLEAMKAGDVVLFSLDAMGDANTARQLGNLALQDLTSAFGTLGKEGFGTNGRMVFTCVDEFSALGGSLLKDLYARGRGAGAAIALASQDLDGDLAAVSPEFRTQVLVNANVVVLHQQRGDTAPDMWAKAIGTTEVWKETLQVTADNGLLGVQEAASGVGSLREAHEFMVSPDTLRNLRQGEAIVIIGHPERRIGQVRIARPSLDDVEVPQVERQAASVTPAADVATSAVTVAAAPTVAPAIETVPVRAEPKAPPVPELYDDDHHDAPPVEPED